MSKKPVKTQDETKKTEVDLSKLKEALGKLTIGVQKLGDVLGAPPAENKKTDNVKNPHIPDVEMSQDEKKAQRQAKAAAKKAKAEAAAAKKGQAVAAPKEVAKKVVEEKSAPKQNEKVVKSAMKSVPTAVNGKEVQFDLTANVSKRVSESEDSTIILDVPVVPLETAVSTENISPIFLTLVARCEKGVIADVETVCQEFIKSFRQFALTWTEQHSKIDPATFGKLLEADIKPQISYLTNYGKRPLPYALGNIVRQLKRQLKEPCTGSVKDVAEELVAYLDECLRTNFDLAYSSIFFYLKPKLENLKSVLTYSWCPVVNSVLLEALDLHDDFEVCIVDDELNGKGMKQVNSIVEKNYHCQYTDLKSVGSLISRYSFVLLGCSAILSNGCVVTSKGALQICLLARTFNKPVMVTAQSFKFVDKVQTYPKTALLDNESLELIPSSLITAVVTDIRILAPTAAPAVLKTKALDQDA